MASRSEVLAVSACLAPESRGAQGSFGDFFDDARRSLLPQLRRSFGDVADDVFQDSLLVVFERWDAVSALDHPMAWVRTVAVRLALRRRERDTRRPLLEARSQGRAVSVRDAADDHDLLRALATLRPDHAAAFRLTQVSDLDVDEAASRLGVPPGTVKTWVHRARARIASPTVGLDGTWLCESVVTPAALERSLVDHGHARHVDAAMACLVDRAVRWKVVAADGRYTLFTDDDEYMDQGTLRLGAHRLTLTSIATTEVVDGVRSPVQPGSNVGSSTHDVQFDGDQLRIRMLGTDVAPTNGVPDAVFREIYFDDVVYRWVGPARSSADSPSG